MHKKLFFSVIPSAIVLSSASAKAQAQAQAQHSAPKVDIGGQVSIIRFRDLT